MIKVIMVAFAGLASASVAAAQQADFDGAKDGPKRFSTVIAGSLAAGSDIPVPSRNSFRDPAAEDIALKAAELAIEGVILQARLMKETGLQRNLEKLLAEGTPEQKKEFAAWKEGVYRFPANIAPRSGAKGVCRWITSTVCEWTCDFGSSGETAQNCKNECRKILVEACD